MQSRRAKLALIFTGGTISMTHAAADGSAVPTLVGADICRAVPGLAEQFDIFVVEYGQLPGPHVSLHNMLELAAKVKAALAQGADGVVLTHGTDTLEETAYFLDLLHDDARPVVLVGAMRTRDELSWDGPINLYSGCLVAAAPQARGKGVMVVMNNTINAASEVTKTYTEAVDTFVSPDLGPLGIVDVGRVLLYRQPVRREVLALAAAGSVATASAASASASASAGGDFARVETLLATVDADGLLVDAAVAAGAAGVVVAALGRGNVPPAMADALVRAVRQGVRVVVCSRCWGGRVAPVYGYPGAGARLLDGGVIFAPWLNAPKARVALLLALRAGYSAAALRRLFDSPGMAA